MDKYFLPSVESGKYFEQNGTILLPVAILCHHASTDGYHVGLFYRELQEFCDDAESWLNLNHKNKIF